MSEITTSLAGLARLAEFYPLQLSTNLPRHRKQLNSAPYGRFRIQSTGLQLSVQRDGQLLLADSPRSKRFEERFNGSHIGIWINSHPYLVRKVNSP